MMNKLNQKQKERIKNKKKNNKHVTKKINKFKTWFFEKINELDKPSASKTN